MKKYIVYMHISPSQKKYIGITCRKPSERWGKGTGYFSYSKKQFNKYFIRAIKKYGWDNFQHIILEKDLTEEEAREKEKFYIQLYDTFHNGYNATLGGEGCSGHVVSEEARKKISAANKGRIPWNKGIPLSEEAKRHLSELNKGKPSYKRTPEIADKIRKARANYVVSEETKRKSSESHKGQPGYWAGKHRDEATKEKLRQASLQNPNKYWLGKKRPPETIEKMRQANLGKKMKPEIKEKIRQKLLGKKRPPEVMEKTRQANLGSKRSPESRERMRQARLRYLAKKSKGEEDGN